MFSETFNPSEEGVNLDPVPEPAARDIARDDPAFQLFAEFARLAAE
ncbi:MAG: hypothetical protein HRJ53_24085, partial [Acidobacteria bacterium Pan2503]|nr:hypothetical protein [Candidatus Acidoferrum panamensis]